MKYLSMILPLVFVGFSATANQAQKSAQKSASKSEAKSQTKSQIQRKSVPAKKASQAPKIKEAGQYGTNHAFDGATLNGRLNEGSLRKIVVENDKSLDDLLGVRKKFDDRQGEEKQRNASW